MNKFSFGITYIHLPKSYCTKELLTFNIINFLRNCLKYFIFYMWYFVGQPTIHQHLCFQS